MHKKVNGSTLTESLPNQSWPSRLCSAVEVEITYAGEISPSECNSNLCRKPCIARQTKDEAEQESLNPQLIPLLWRQSIDTSIPRVKNFQ